MTKRKPIPVTRASRARETSAKAVMLNARCVFDLLQPQIANAVQESFFVLVIDIRNRLIDCVEVAKGTVHSVEVHPREVFRPAIELAGSGIVVAHNHPSGDTTPSADDILLTRRLREAGDLLGIPVVDHVVVSRDGYVSFAESEQL